MAVAVIVASIGYVKSDPHDYEECASAAQIAALNDMKFNATIDPDYKPNQTQKNQTEIDNNIKCSDLGAQWGTADIALLGYIAGLLGLVFLGITVFETQSAAQAARDTLGIARDTLTEAKINSKRELRAYLKVEVDIRNIYNTISVTDSKPVEFSVRLKNGGSTPAHSVELQCRIYSGSVEYMFEPKWAEYGDGVLISPAQEVIREYSTSGGALESSLKEKMRSPHSLTDTDAIMVKVDIEYTDVFDYRHTQVCMFSVLYSDIEKAAKTASDKTSGRRVENIYYVEKTAMLLMASDETSEKVQDS